MHLHFHSIEDPSSKQYSISMTHNKLWSKKLVGFVKSFLPKIFARIWAKMCHPSAITFICEPTANFIWQKNTLNIQLTYSYMQGLGNAVEGLGRSGGTLGSRCPPLEQPTPLLPPPKDALPFRTLFVCLSLGRPLSLLEDLSRWPSAAPGRPGVSSSCLAGTGKQGSIPSWTRVQNWPPAPNAHPCPPLLPWAV